MDVTARIEEVIVTKGLTKSMVAKRMGKFNQAFNRLITNPKWETIELVAQAIGISTEELLFGKKTNPLEKIIKTSDRGGNSYTSEDAEKSQTVGMLVCPHCGKGIKFKVRKM